MPKFVTISPTHIPGKKEYAWNNFKTGGYIAIGWMPVDLTGKSLAEVTDIIKDKNYPNEDSAIDAFDKFFSLQPGDYVAVNNTNHGLFGIGIIKSGYHFEKYKHDTGADDKEECYSHLIDVEWKTTSYVNRKDILEAGETSWQPYGTIGSILPEVPLYVRRVLGETIKTPIGKVEYTRPDWLDSVIKSVEILRADLNHQERAHESLVEDFFCVLGYTKHLDIKYRQGRVDITLFANNKPVLLVEVKRDWDLSTYNGKAAIQQAYGYALEKGIRFVLVTNGDYYLIFDRLKGLSYDSNIVGDFRLTALEKEDLEILDRLRRERLEKPNLEELFKNVSESFT